MSRAMLLVFVVGTGTTLLGADPVAPSVPRSAWERTTPTLRVGEPGADVATRRVAEARSHAERGNEGVLPCAADCDVGCDGSFERQGWVRELLDREQPLLADWRNVPLFVDPGDCDGASWYHSVGGEFRHRYMDERNRLRPFGAQQPSTYHLTRFTPWIEAGNDRVRAYVQGIDAQITGHEIPFTPIDRNRWDLLQYYLDVTVGELDGAPVRVRYGRQVLKFGDQHLVSPLGWANTFRNFEGVRGTIDGDVWTVDGFATQAVNDAAVVARRRPNRHDVKDESKWFSGVYATYHEAPHGSLDLFWLWFNENEPRQVLHDGDRHTIGARYNGKYAILDCDEAVRTYFWDVSGGYQFGRDSFLGRVQNVQAGFVSATTGVTLDDVAWKPTLQGLFWYGSGDDDPTDGTIGTYNSLYPLGHAYWGIIDNHNGQNLLDYAVQVSVKPTGKLTYVAAWHWFDKATRNDFVYNIVGAPLGPAARTDANIGNELDLIATYKFNPNFQIQAGYSMYWYGDAVNRTALARADAKQFYLMTTLGF